ncbi:related to cytochrome P450 94A1 [Cephalotrichum gorgonifer]|uniref:Related to cytochrome P450 94A1 n=1 Tax=Cephalotrichum gorgonifer TaxID=2041049 RepID=A0AAE8MSQ4_9PEZI|nr:related to cytochrome P450 94A1 [Cephalotrichum gorgonifer]
MALLALPQTLILPTLLLPILALVYSHFQPPIRRNGVPIPKAPDTLPLLGNALHFLRPRQDLLAWFTACERRFPHQTLQISVPTVGTGVIVSSPANVDFVLRNEGVFSKGEFVKSRSLDLFGHGIINVDGEPWRRQRKAGLAFLSAANLRVLTEVALPKYLGESVDALRRKVDAGEVDGGGRGAEVDMQSVFHEITTRLMGRTAYGMDMHADDEFTLAFEYASGVTAERFQNPLWRVTELLFGARFRRALAVVRNHGHVIVRSAIESRASESREGNKERVEKEEAGDIPGVISGSLVRSLLDSIGDERLVADAALNYLSAGRDTTAQALTWTLHLLTRHSDEVSLVRREVESILRSSATNTYSPSSPDPSLFTPTSAPYTLAVLYEGLRLYPPVPIEIKQTTRSTTLPDGTHLPTGSVVLWSTWSMNRSLETWGPSADSFLPSRWLSRDEPPRFFNRSAGEFPVFNGGPRVCLGKKMAEAVGVQVLAVMLWLFEFESEDVERRSPSSLTLPMEGGLPCFVRRRSFDGWGDV